MFDELPIAAIRRRPPAALVARVSSDDDVQRLLQAGVRVVNVSAARETAFPHAIPDEQAIGRMAARCSRGLGLRRFIYFGDGAAYSIGRRKGLVAEARRRGCQVVATPEDVHPASVDLRGIVDGGDGRPVGILACNDDTACAVLQRCVSAGVRVPQVACILGVGNEDIVLIRSPLPLSSIELPAYGIGAMAAEMVILYQKSLEKLRPLEVEVVCLARNGAFLGQDARNYISRSIKEAEKMRQEIIRRFQGAEDLEGEIGLLARERYEGLKTRDIPWDVYLGLMRGVVRKILINERKSN